MRNLILFGPFFWLRKVVLWILILLFILVLFVYFAGNSSLAVKKALDTFAPDYNISYTHISGNVFSGFEIINPQYNHQTIAKKAILKWNPNLLSKKEIQVTQLHLEDANVDVIGALVSTFSSDTNNTSEDNATNDFDFKVNIRDIDISLTPFMQNDISVTHTRLKSNHIRYHKNKVFVDTATLTIAMNSEIYDDILIDTIALNVDNAVYDISTNSLKEADAKIHTTSNISSLDFQGKIKDNHLLGKVVLVPKDALYTIYKLPLRKDAIQKIVVDLDASKERILADIDTKAKHLLAVKKGAFNVDVNTFHSRVAYDINSNAVKVLSQAMIDTPYAKNINIKNNLMYHRRLQHDGEVVVPRLEGIDAKYAKLLSNFHLQYKGDSKGIDTAFYSDALKGTFVSKDFKIAQAHLETKQTVALANIVTLPKELQDAKVNISIDAPLNLQDFSKIDVQVKAKSNIINIDGKVHYAKTIIFDSDIVIPQNSLIKLYSKDIKWKSLSPMKTSIRYGNDTLNVKLKAEALHTNVGYNIQSGMAKGKMRIAGILVDVRGNTNNKLKIKTNITSLDTLGKDLNTLYDIGELPPIKGKIEATLVVDKLQSAALSLKAPKLIYKVDKHTKKIIEDVTLVASMDADKILLKSYQATYDKQKYYATKEAKITLGDTIEVSNFWLNDELLFEGKYNSKTQKGDFKATAQRFHVKNKIVDIYTKIDSSIFLEGENTNVTGKITLLEGTITPQASGRSFASDSDIIILQHIRKKKKSSFMDNLNLMLQIDTQKSLRLKQKNVRLRLKPALTITKQKRSDMLFLGDISLLKGGTYKLEDKKIILEKSHIYLTGKVDKPTLDVKAKYKSLNHLITIGVTGTPTKPRLDFSASPTLTKEQILSVLLFDTETGGDTHSGDAMMKMMGGAMAKAALSEVGVKVDHLVFGEGNSIEVGKKLTKRVTVIYVNAEVPKVKVKYKHNRHTESVIGASEESQSFDIIFKKDF